MTSTSTGIDRRRFLKRTGMAAACIAVNPRVLAAPRPRTDQVKVITLNIKTSKAGGWESRKQRVFDYLIREAADFVCLQEAQKRQIQDIIGGVGGNHRYKVLGFGRGEKYTGEHTAILYRTSGNGWKHAPILDECVPTDPTPVGPLMHTLGSGTVRLRDWRIPDPLADYRAPKGKYDPAKVDCWRANTVSYFWNAYSQWFGPGWNGGPRCDVNRVVTGEYTRSVLRTSTAPLPGDPHLVEASGRRVRAEWFVGGKKLGMQGGHPRCFTWGRFRRRNSPTCLYIYNTHLDNKIKNRRWCEMRQMLDHMMARHPDSWQWPTIITCDLNDGEGSGPYQDVLKLRRGSSDHPFFDVGNPLPITGGTQVRHGRATRIRMDFVFAAGVDSIRCDYGNPNGPVDPASLSDHTPVRAQLKFTVPE